jgi:hypothetical protein
MAIIKEGYNGEELRIRISGQKDNVAEVWIDQYDKEGKHRETLAYATLQELADLKREIEQAMLKIIGIDHD